MKRILLSSALIIIVVVPASYGQSSATPFSSLAGYFTIQMPGSDPTESPASDGYARHGIVTSVDGTTTYTVEYKCYCDRFDQTELAAQQVKRMIDDIQARTGQTVISETNVTLVDGPGRTKLYAGKEFKLESNSSFATYHIYLADDMSYALSVVSEKSNPSPAKAAGFFSSFRLGVDLQLIKDPPPAFRGGVPGGTLAGVPANSSGDKTLNRSEGVIKGNAISLVSPTYPPLARQARLQGKVMVDIVIGEEGKVIYAVARCGHPLLVAASLKAVRNSLFKPTLLAGVPVKVQGVLTYNFRF